TRFSRDWSSDVCSSDLQCHSLPLLYLILAEEMNAKAWMALAPQHAYIVFESDKGLINFETTNGHLVDDEWIMKSGFISTNSIKRSEERRVGKECRSRCQ